MKKGILAIANRKEKKPSTKDQELPWLEKDEKALAIIALGLSDSYIHHINGCKTSFEAWSHFENVFGTHARCANTTYSLSSFPCH